MYKKSSHLKNKVLPKKKTREAVGPSKVDSSIPLTTAVWSSDVLQKFDPTADNALH